MSSRRVSAFVILASALGFGRARRIADGWRTAFAAEPLLLADLAALGFLDEPSIRDRSGRPAPLPSDELQFREGARSVARAIMDRAGLTHIDMTTALEALHNETDLESMDGLPGA